MLGSGEDREMLRQLAHAHPRRNFSKFLTFALAKSFVGRKNVAGAAVLQRDDWSWRDEGRREEEALEAATAGG